jgi:hypothetical protein
MAAHEIMNSSITGAESLDRDRQLVKLCCPGPPLALFTDRGKALS